MFDVRRSSFKVRHWFFHSTLDLEPRPLKNAQFWSRSRKAKILTTGIYAIFRGLKFEPDAEIGPKGAFCKGLEP
jgi:hypothetical protein